MSRDWTPDELRAVSVAMKAAGHMSYEEFCESIHKAENADSSEIDAPGEKG